MHIRCPICKREIKDAPEDFPTRPFCSPRCKTIDLGNWLSEAYRITRPLGPDDVDLLDNPDLLDNLDMPDNLDRDYPSGGPRKPN